jgi:hypothetical protein
MRTIRTAAGPTAACARLSPRSEKSRIASLIEAAEAFPSPGKAIGRPLGSSILAALFRGSPVAGGSVKIKSNN